MLGLSSVKIQTAYWIKQNRKRSLLQGFQPANQVTQGYKSNESRVAHRLRGFNGKNTKITLLFQLIGCLVVFFLIWMRVAESGNKKFRVGSNRPSRWGLAGDLCWLLRRAFHSYKVVSFTCLHWWSPFRPWHKGLHLHLVLYLRLVRFPKKPLSALFLPAGDEPDSQVKSRHMEGCMWQASPVFHWVGAGTAACQHSQDKVSTWLSASPPTLTHSRFKSLWLLCREIRFSDTHFLQGGFLSVSRSVITHLFSWEVHS